MGRYLYMDEMGCKGFAGQTPHFIRGVENGSCDLVSPANTKRI
jgi:hypothetical protein